MVRLPSLCLWLHTVPPLLSASSFGTSSWRQILKPLAAGPSGGSRHLKLVLLQKAECWTHGYIIIITLQLTYQSYWSVCPSFCRWCGCVPHRSWASDNSHLFLTSVCLLLLFRDLLTTAHTQVCTVIRFSQSRFVPASRILVLLDLPLSLLETLWLAGLDISNVCSSSLFLSLLVDSLGYWEYTPLHSRSETVLYHFSLFTLLLFFCFSSAASQMVFPRYDHGFLSGEQSNTFQRRFLKVDHYCMHVHLRPANHLFSLMLD